MLDGIKEELAEKGRLAIKTQTMRDRIINHSSLVSADVNTLYLADIGLTQVIQSVLWADGWRSVGSGYFAQLDSCGKEAWVVAMKRNSKTRLDQAAGADGMVSRQLCFMGVDLELFEEPAPEDLLADLEAHAI